MEGGIDEQIIEAYEKKRNILEFLLEDNNLGGKIIMHGNEEVDILQALHEIEEDLSIRKTNHPHKTTIGGKKVMKKISKKISSKKRGRGRPPTPKGMITAAQIASGLKIAGREAINILKASRLKKPSSGWTWNKTDKKSITAVEKILLRGAKKPASKKRIIKNAAVNIKAIKKVVKKVTKKAGVKKRETKKVREKK